MRVTSYVGLTSVISLCVLVAGCGSSETQKYFDKMKPLTNQQIAEQVNFCKKNRLFPSQYENSFGQTVWIQCYHEN